MSITPAVTPVAAGMLTVAVTGDQGSSHGGGDDPGGPADVEGLGAGSEDDRAEGAVTGVAADLVGGENLAVAGFVDPTPKGGPPVIPTRRRSGRLQGGEDQVTGDRI